MALTRTLPPALRNPIAASYKSDLELVAGPIDTDIVYFYRQRCLDHGHPASVVLQYKKGGPDDGRYIIVVTIVPFVGVGEHISLNDIQCSSQHPGDILGNTRLFAYVSPPISLSILREIQDRKFARELQAHIDLSTCSNIVRQYFTAFVSPLPLKSIRRRSLGVRLPVVARSTRRQLHDTALGVNLGYHLQLSQDLSLRDCGCRVCKSCPILTFTSSVR